MSGWGKLIMRNGRKPLTVPAPCFVVRSAAVERMMPKWPRGQYRTQPGAKRKQMAYVIDGNIASFLDEETYRAKGYEPVFDQLPTEDEYHA